MSVRAEAASGLPPRMSGQRAGDGIRRWGSERTTAPFLVQLLLSGRVDGELSAMRAWLEPGVISHWHSHPLGQLLHVLDGVGRAQREGGDIVEVRAGDTLWFAPGERHWHGAAADSPFAYLSVQPVRGGSAADWFEPVEPAPRS